MKADGHDGVVLDHGDGMREYVAFEPTQVKSAIGNTGNTGNTGNFDGADERIDYSDEQRDHKLGDERDTGKTAGLAAAESAAVDKDGAELGLTAKQNSGLKDDARDTHKHFSAKAGMVQVVCTAILARASRGLSVDVQVLLMLCWAASVSTRRAGSSGSASADGLPGQMCQAGQTVAPARLPM